MEHEVFVPVTAEALRRTLRDPARVARCVPGLQQDADGAAGPLAGRLRIRVGGHTITYRGSLTLTERDGVFTAEGEGTEVRGTGSVKVTLAVRLAQAPGGTALTFTGGSHVEGRLAEFPAETTVAAAHRLLDRLVVRLGEESAAPGPESSESSERQDPPADGDVDADVDADGSVRGDGDVRESGDVRRDVSAGDDTGAETCDDTCDDIGAGTGDDTGADIEPGAEGASIDAETVSGEGDFLVPDEPPAEAAHARRTMIGRSAEEVDHAPPRGRYAPVPAPDAAGTRATLRWVAPAAALALASAVVVGRALRRRK
ncbi:SRPBCC domain-containing protein [Streptomyces sp. NPDC088400]|uniref:SRPBCC domain-containing protein n=1 Tax=Streptomyces sp. NPDC088400 TaxID=3365861 RepID=UPI0038069E20